MKILRRLGMPYKTAIPTPAPLDVRRAAAEVLVRGDYDDEEEIEDALVIIGGYLWKTPKDWDEDEDRDRWGHSDDPRAVAQGSLGSLKRRREHVAQWDFLGRQLSVGDAGILDLLGQRPGDPEGLLTIYEIKANQIRHADLSQVASYRATAEELDPDDLAWLIASNSGQRGISRNWHPDDLRRAIAARYDEEENNYDLFQDRDPGYDPDFRRIGCAVIGLGWKAKDSRLASDMGVELIDLPRLAKMALREIEKAEADAGKEEEAGQRLRPNW